MNSNILFRTRSFPNLTHRSAWRFAGGLVSPIRICLLLVIFLTLKGSMTWASDSPTVGKSFPNAIFSTLNDGSWRIADHRGRVLLIEFWATDCAPCLKHLPQLRRLNKKWKDRKDPLLVGIPTDPNMAPVRRFVKRHRIQWSQLCSGDQTVYAFIAGQYRLKEIFTPTFWVIDKRGRIAHSVVGDLQLATKLAESLSSSDKSEIEQIEPEKSKPHSADSRSGSESRLDE